MFNYLKEGFTTRIISAILRLVSTIKKRSVYFFKNSYLYILIDTFLNILRKSFKTSIFGKLSKECFFDSSFFESSYFFGNWGKFFNKILFLTKNNYTKSLISQLFTDFSRELSLNSIKGISKITFIAIATNLLLIALFKIPESSFGIVFRLMFLLISLSGFFVKDARVILSNSLIFKVLNEKKGPKNNRQT